MLYTGLRTAFAMAASYSRYANASRGTWRLYLLASRIGTLMDASERSWMLAERGEERPEPAGPEIMLVGSLQLCNRCSAFHRE